MILNFAGRNFTGDWYPGRSWLWHFCFWNKLGQRWNPQHISERQRFVVQDLDKCEVLPESLFVIESKWQDFQHCGAEHCFWHVQAYERSCFKCFHEIGFGKCLEVNWIRTQVSFQAGNFWSKSLKYFLSFYFFIKGVYRVTNFSADENLVPFPLKTRAFADLRFVGRVNGVRKNIFIQSIKIFFEKR